ncbi:MAG TPA: tRNA uridine-5-carboxymethylaminomethyl(34) synthesis GTPase MnmE, partial [Alicycliphilus sp.]|nr:tRNA uridine-5-carboxymethylaminomethyl(34) synthesis GTPase MnmE [Alicycliphilus sp.]
EVERLGIARAWEEIAGADAVLFLHDLTRLDAPEYLAADADIASDLAKKLPENVPIIDVWNKQDASRHSAPPAVAGHEAVHLSARTGAGLDTLRQRLLQVTGWQQGAEGVYIARARHLEALRAVDAHLMEAAAQLMSDGPALDLLAEELRLAQNALNSITGEFGADDLLGVIFSSFCIGK